MKLKGLVVALLLTFGVAVNAAQDIRIYTADNQGGKVNAKTIEKAFKDAGFYITGNNDMNKAFEAKFKDHAHDAYNLMTLHKKDAVTKLLKKYPNIALFTPLSMSIFTKKGEKNISVSSMSAAGIAKITGIPADNADLVAYMKDVADVLAKAMPNGKFEDTHYKIAKPEGDLVKRFTMEMDVKPDEIEDELDGLQEELEAGLETAGFVLAGYNKLGDDLAKAGDDTYDFFDVYSICKVAVIYEVSKTHPEAGAFAPCSFSMYKKKGDKTVHFAYPSVYNWISSIDVTDKASKDVLLKAQKAMNAAVNEATEE
ncbi:hypothetical protein YH65_10390 [Sulfurovum lithotrophicum]|uniref:DUF302 domain-containing protein n=1 Tax=Sulfurovum lithotrophicum TaxID=206403 RepID=A0A7U4M2N4_9BACT|nr:DUF302 domain-containing protein [Sulfurovum lithotrophicum]AKF25750.1 hypothetical protein YH65_10390 [Sulfurovum lithotrophicum]